MEEESDIPNIQEVNVTKPKTPKKRHLFFKIVVLPLTVLVLVIVLVAGWFGFVPGVSDVMGARSPKDLGVKWSVADYESYKLKTGTTFQDFKNAPDNPSKPGKKTVFADPKTVSDLSLTQEQITAAINSIDWSWMPASDVQVRLSNNTVEVSGKLQLEHVEQFVNFIGGVGYSSEDVSRAANLGRRLVSGGAFYAKGTSSVTDNVLTLDLQEITIGRYAVPIGIAQKVIYTGGSNGINKADNLDIKSATVGNGSLNVTGTYPTTIYVLH